jgi:hypothetical protein
MVLAIRIKKWCNSQQLYLIRLQIQMKLSAQQLVCGYIDRRVECAISFLILHNYVDFHHPPETIIIRPNVL